mmetsp:Transcript_78802/g.222925  ORF Transcript_78802/g.222925 Transcript_78802/m.222925 type:complete len:269 (-) Transcript_78802:420-1226(-)
MGGPFGVKGCMAPAAVGGLGVKGCTDASGNGVYGAGPAPEVVGVPGSLGVPGILGVPGTRGVPGILGVPGIALGVPGIAAFLGVPGIRLRFGVPGIRLRFGPIGVEGIMFMRFIGVPGMLWSTSRLPSIGVPGAGARIGVDGTEPRKEGCAGVAGAPALAVAPWPNCGGLAELTSGPSSSGRFTMGVISFSSPEPPVVSFASSSGNSSVGAALWTTSTRVSTSPANQPFAFHFSRILLRKILAKKRRVPPPRRARLNRFLRCVWRCFS